MQRAVLLVETVIAVFRTMFVSSSSAVTKPWPRFPHHASAESQAIARLRCNARAVYVSRQNVKNDSRSLHTWITVPFEINSARSVTVTCRTVRQSDSLASWPWPIWNFCRIICLEMTMTSAQPCFINKKMPDGRAVKWREFFSQRPLIFQQFRGWSVHGSVMVRDHRNNSTGDAKHVIYAKVDHPVKIILKPSLWATMWVTTTDL